MRGRSLQQVYGSMSHLDLSRVPLQIACAVSSQKYGAKLIFSLWEVQESRSWTVQESQKVIRALV